MIKHTIHYFDLSEGITLTWVIEFPYRLNKGDELYYELLFEENLASWSNNKQPDKWDEVMDENDYFIVEDVQIDHIKNIEIWLEIIPKDKRGNEN